MSYEIIEGASGREYVMCVECRSIIFNPKGHDRDHLAGTTLTDSEGTMSETPDFYEMAWRRGFAVETLIVGGVECATSVAGPESVIRIELGPRILEHREAR